MAFDGIVARSIMDELNEKLQGGRIDKIYQPESDELYIHLRNNGENHILLISASSNNPRLYLTERVKKNPQEPPMFCMILRKHLQGSRIISIDQFLMDRIIFIDIESRDELGFENEKRIVVEIMGRHSNIILIDKGTNKIIDSITRVSEDMSSVRQIFPGIDYNLPPLQDKLNPLDISKVDFHAMFKSSDKSIKVFKWIYTNFLGLSPLIAREICFKSNINNNKELGDLSSDELEVLYKRFEELIGKIKAKKYTPNLIYDELNEKIKAFHSMDISQYTGCQKEKYNSISNLLDTYYYKKDLHDRIGQRAQSLKKIVNNNLQRAKNKLKKQKIEFEDAKNRDIYKIYADLISANIYRIEKGSKCVKLENFYDENLEEISIPLDNKKSAAANAQSYYKKYSRLKNAYNLLKRGIPLTKEEILYLENILVSINNSNNPLDIEEIKDELIKENYLKKPKKKTKVNEQSQPHHYKSSTGFDIFVGKNNRQNDLLTFKQSSREDIWLHIQKMPGSHVIIKSGGQEVDNKTLEEAASLAGYYSSARNSNNVAIDYTERKNVKKIKGAKPGLVIYEDFSTIFVSSDIKTINKIKKVGE